MTITSPKRLWRWPWRPPSSSAPARGSGASAVPRASSDPAAPSAAPSGAAPSGAAVSGTINVSGSSTVEPISTGVAEAFKAANPDFNYTVEGPGTGDGFKRFCAGETDISDASRKIKDEEAAALHRPPASSTSSSRSRIDGITVMTTPANTAVTCLRFAGPLRADRPRVAGLQEVDGRRQRSPRSSAPTRPSRTRDLASPAPARSRARSTLHRARRSPAIADRARHRTPTTRPDYTSSANDNVIIEGIAGTASSLGWVGFAFAEENKDKVDGDPGLQGRQRRPASRPSAETIADASYPLSRTLYIYVNKAKAAANPAVVGLRRLLPRRRHDRDGPREGPVREPPGRRAGRSRGPPGTPPSEPPSSATGRASSEARPVRLSSPLRLTRPGSPTTDGTGHAAAAPTRHLAARQPAPAAGASGIVRALFLGAALLSVVISAFIILSVLGEAISFLPQIDLSQLFSDRLVPAPRHVRHPDAAGRVVPRHRIAMLIAAPVGLRRAIYLAEYATPRVRGTVKPILEILAGIPSVVLGFFALTLINPYSSSRSSRRQARSTCSPPASPSGS